MANIVKIYNYQLQRLFNCFRSSVLVKLINLYCVCGARARARAFITIVINILMVLVLTFYEVNNRYILRMYFMPVLIE